MAAAPRAAIQVHPLAHAPRTALSASRPGVAPDARTLELAERLRQRIGAIRQPRSGGTAAGAPPSAFRALARLRQEAGADVQVRLRPRLGTPMQIRGAVLEAGAAAGAAASADGDEALARRFLVKRRELLRLDDPDRELALTRRDTDSFNRRHLRFSQRFRGLPVWPAELLVHIDAAGNIDAFDGAFVPTPRNLPGGPALDGVAALAAARATVVGGAAAPVTAEPELIVYAPGNRRPRLAWKLELAPALATRWVVVVDAISGAVLTAFNRLPSANVATSADDLFGIERPLNVYRDTDGTFYLVDTSKPIFDPTSQPPLLESTRGAITILDARNQPPTSDPEQIPDLFYVTSGNANAWSPADAVSAAFGLSQTFDYYSDRHGRSSLDGQGGSILAVVRLGRDFFNAFWNGSLMVFGDAEPFAGSLDVVAHELTHGVTDYTANLVYREQSGAMNEAFSDIFGEMVEARTNGDNDWLIGSDISQPIRSMENPSLFGDPATMSDFVTTDLDNGGVHTNSGIFNHAFYLVAEGLGDALGLRDAESIFYRALAFHLVTNSQFIDGRLACIAAAEEIFGAGSRQARVVGEAFDAVEIFDGRSTPPPAPFPGVEGVDSTLSLYYDDIEESYFLARREEGFDDPIDGVQLIDLPVAASRPAVSGDGSFAVFVNADNDVCFVQTDGTPIDPESGTIEECLGFAGFISSVGVAPDGDHFGFVLLDEEGSPDNLIRVIDLTPGGETRSFELHAPVEDGTTIDSVLYADTLAFTADNHFLIYDALNVARVAACVSDCDANGVVTVDELLTVVGIALANLQVDQCDNADVDGNGRITIDELVITVTGVVAGCSSDFFAWSIYALDLDSGEFLSIVPPIPGLDLAYPALSRTSDSFITFDAYDNDSGQSTVMTADLTTGVKVEIATVDGGFGVPAYFGDDAAIVFSQADDTPTEFSLYRQQLAGDRLTPSGSATPWLSDADFGVIYRRGVFTGPPDARNVGQ